MKTNESLQSFKLAFGKHKGKKLDETPLLYLDWLVGQEWLAKETKETIVAYLSDPVIEKELTKELNHENQ